MNSKKIIIIGFISFAILVFLVAAISVPLMAMQLAPVFVAHNEVVSLSSDLPKVNIDTVSYRTGDFSIGPLKFSQQSGSGDKLVIGGAFVLREGETLEGSLFIMGGTARLEPGSLVEQDVVLVGGSVNVDGTVEGDIIAIGGFANLSETAQVEGDVNAIGGHVTYDNRDSIEGDVNTGLPGGPLVVPGSVVIPELPAVSMQQSLFSGWMGAVTGLLFWMLRSFMWAVLAVIAVLFLPRNVERTSNVVVNQPLISGGLGLLTALVAPLMILMIAITIIGIPISLLAVLLLFIAWAYGIISIGVEIGKRLAMGLNQEWALPVSAAVGTLIVTLIINGIGEVIPCIGWMVPALVGMIGLGATILTRFGTQNYPSSPVAIIPGQPGSPVTPAMDIDENEIQIESTMDEPEPPAGNTKIVDEPDDGGGEAEETA